MRGIFGLTTKQNALLLFIHERIKADGVSPSFDEMKEALNLASKSGIHRLIVALEERGFIRTDGHDERDSGIALARGGVILVGNGSVSTFVPNPDHIHKTGVSDDRQQCVSLHLYGRDMSNFHVYDKDAGTRKLIDVKHN